jgi:hypothetical protein
MFKKFCIFYVAVDPQPPTKKRLMMCHDTCCVTIYQIQHTEQDADLHYSPLQITTLYLLSTLSDASKVSFLFMSAVLWFHYDTSNKYQINVTEHFQIQ